MATLTSAERNAYEARAWYLGADAGASMQGAVILTDDEAQAILDDGAHDVVRPDLPRTLLAELTGGRDDIDDDSAAELEAEIAEAWESGRDATFSNAVRAMAARTVGRLSLALELEGFYERVVDAARRDAERAEALAAKVPIMREQVARGIEALDTFAADTGEIPNRWRELIDIARLDLTSIWWCVLGQVWWQAKTPDASPETFGSEWDERADYHDAREALHLVTDQAVQSLGFLAEGDGTEDYRILADTLTTIWQDALRAERERLGLDFTPRS